MPNGVLRSPNITPDSATGIEMWDEETFVERFKTYSDSLETVAEGDYNTIMPWAMYAGMKENDLAAIYSYLRSLDPINNNVTRFSAAQ